MWSSLLTNHSERYSRVLLFGGRSRDCLCALEFDHDDGSHRVWHRAFQRQRRLAVLVRELDRCAVCQSIRTGDFVFDRGNFERCTRLAEEGDVELAWLGRDAPLGLRQEQSLSANVLAAA